MLQKYSHIYVQIIPLHCNKTYVHATTKPHLLLFSLYTRCSANTRVWRSWAWQKLFHEVTNSTSCQL